MSSPRRGLGDTAEQLQKPWPEPWIGGKLFGVDHYDGYPLWRFREDRTIWGRGKERDSRRAKVYRAELLARAAIAGIELPEQGGYEIAFRRRFELNHQPADQPTFTTAPQVTSYLHGLYRTRWFDRRFGHRVLPFVDIKRKGSNTSTGGANCLRFARARWPIPEWLVLHELAHVLTPNDASGGGHGRLWRRIYLDLLQFRQPEAAVHYRNLFRAGRLTWSPKRLVVAGAGQHLQPQTA